MKEKLTEFIKSKNGGKALLILGIAGIVLIYVSTFFGGEEKSEAALTSKPEFSADDYCEKIENQVKQIVSAISGDTTAVVTVTLDTDLTYVYADETKQNTQSETELQANETEQTYITVTDSDGSERPLIVTSYMPKVRGVAIVCSAGSEQTREEIKNAVMAALDITSRKVFISDKKGE